MERRDTSADPVELLDHHRRLTTRLARRYGRFEAEDLASEALARSLHHPAPDGARAPWLERILRNLLVDRARRCTRAATHAEALSSVGNRDCGATPEDHLLQAERRLALQEALPTIPSGLRAAVVGRFYEDHDYDTVAAAQGISASTARTRVHRALATLRHSLSRLRAAIPWSQIAAAPSSATAALLPAALSAVLIVPSLAYRPSDSPAARGAVRLAETSRPSSPRSPSPEPPSRGHEIADAASVAAPLKVPRTPPGPTGREQQLERARRSEGQAAAVTNYEFENDEVEGSLRRPDDMRVQGDTAVKHASLIELRREFTSEIAKTLEDL